MAKRKLSIQQRQTIRKEIRGALKEKKGVPDILKAVADKYHISVVTARWYLKTITKQKAKASPRKSAKYSRRAPKRFIPKLKASRSNGAALTLIRRVQSTAQKTLQKALEVKKLIPQWQMYVQKEASLRNIESGLRKKLKAITQKAAAIQRRIRTLSHD